MLAHFRVGSGPRSLVLLHGFMGSGRNLASLARRWSEADAALSLLVPDLTGHGASPPLPPQPDLRVLARDVLQAARAVFEPPYSLVGHSLGGRAALAASLLAPSDIADVTLLDIPPGPATARELLVGGVLRVWLRAPENAASRTEMRDALMSDGLSRPLADWLVMNLEHGPDGRLRWRADRKALEDLARRAFAEDLWPAVERPGARVRCIRGGDSPYVSEDDVRRMQAAGVPVVTLPGASHFLHVDRPDELLAVLRDDPFRPGALR